MPPRQSRNQTPGSSPKPSFTCTAWKPMSLVSSSTGMIAGAVETDVELARQAVERAVVEDVEVPFARIGPRVDQFLRVDAGGRRAGDVADIVGAGAARAQAEVLDRLDHGDGVFRLDLAHLQIGARGDVRVAAAVALGEIGNAGKLRGLENAVRHAQPAHDRNSGSAPRRTGRRSASGNCPAASDIRSWRRAPSAARRRRTDAARA